MKNIETINELRKIEKKGKIKINGVEEVVTGIFPGTLMTYREIHDQIYVIEYKLEKETIEPELGEIFKYPASDYFPIKDVFDSYSN